MKEKLTIDKLNSEFLVWANKYGNSRDEQDLRFGQYIHIKYELPKVSDYTINDGFSSENVNVAYGCIVKLITNNK
jgi:hypothetical protein